MQRKASAAIWPDAAKSVPPKTGEGRGWQNTARGGSRKTVEGGAECEGSSLKATLPTPFELDCSEEKKQHS